MVTWSESREAIGTSFCQSPDLLVGMQYAAFPTLNAGLYRINDKGRPPYLGTIPYVQDECVGRLSGSEQIRCVML